MYSIRIKHSDFSAASVGWKDGTLGMWQSQSTPNEAKHSQMIEKDHCAKVSEKKNGGAVVR